MKVSVLTALFCFILFTLSAQNGVLKTIGGAAKNKVEQQDFNSTRSNKERLNGDRKRSSAAPAPGSAAPSESAAPDSTAAPAPETPPVTPSVFGTTKYNDSYTFEQQLTYETEDLGDSKDNKETITYFYSDGAIMSKVGDQQTTILMDFGNESMISFDEENKTATAMSTRWASKMAAKQVEKQSDGTTVTKTGNTKQILGYNCEEYIIEGKTKSVCWITSEIHLDYARTMAAISKGNPDTKADEFSAQGLMMEVTTYDKKGNPDTHMILTEFKEETLVKLLSGYTVTAF
jgi:hypothetical protein